RCSSTTSTTATASARASSRSGCRRREGTASGSSATAHERARVSWSLHRIDDRLIHGQVLVAWGARLDPARIWVVDDGVAANAWERDLFREAAPGIEVRVTGVADAAAAYAEETSARGAAFLLVRDLATARRLVEAGAVVREWNVGGLHYSPGKDKVNDYVYLDARDRDDARALLAAGSRLLLPPPPRPRGRAGLAPRPAPRARSGPDRVNAGLAATLAAGGLAALDATPVAQTLASQPLVTATLLGIAWGDWSTAMAVGTVLQILA